MEGSKELNNILKAIQKWMDKYRGDVNFIASFSAFEGKDFNVVDGRILAYGTKECIKINLKELDKELKKEKGEFVNW